MTNSPPEKDSPTILVVDDNERNRLLLEGFLASLGYASIKAENGLEALRIIEEKKPDLVLLDLLMPEMDGTQVLEKLNEKGLLLEMPVVVVTAVEEQEILVQCIRLGADDYLLKPFNPILLRARIEACLEKRRFRKKEKQLHEELQTGYENLKKLETARDALTHMIVHDLTNPLAIVNGYVYLLLEKFKDFSKDKDKARHALIEIREAVEEMARMTKGILDVSKLESGQMPVSRERFEAVAFARGVSDKMRVHAEKRGIRLTFASEEEAIEVVSDREILERVFQNLLSNSIKHIEENSEVTFRVWKEEARVLFSISDNGPGIPEEYRDEIFEKYFQIKTKKKGKYGVGLGLTFCKMAVEALKGNISVESEEGKGARFTVELKAETE